MKRFQKATAFALASITIVAALSGCGGNKKVDGKINLSVGGWPNETNPKSVEKYEEYKEQMMAKYPDVNVIPDTTGYADAKTFTMKASAGQLPTTYVTHFTEVQQTIDAGYAADITDVMQERGLIDAINPNILETVKGKDGKLYAFPSAAYMMGININKSLFEEAGLVNEDGTVMVPDTYEELAETASIIKQKTGKAGYVICTTNNCGGWHFLNMAWSWGVDFMEMGEDGKWKATFNTPEAVAALEYVKDLKWKWDALPDEQVIDQTTGQKLVGVGQAAMIFDGPIAALVTKYGMDPSDFALARLPKGPAGRHVQMGGSVYMFSNTATPEEINAAFDWLELIGYANIQLDEETWANKEKDYQTQLEENKIVFPLSPMTLWADPDRLSREKELNKKYCNVADADVTTYMDLSDTILKPEEPACCQQLYAVLDGCIQEVLTNENADCAALIEKACNDFQVNHLDKM